MSHYIMMGVINDSNTDTEFCNLIALWGKSIISCLF